jgi:hypothetical protein
MSKSTVLELTDGCTVIALIRGSPPAILQPDLTTVSNPTNLACLHANLRPQQRFLNNTLPPGAEPQYIHHASVLNSEVEDLPTRIKTHIPPELQYACRHWAWHVSNGRVSEILDSLGEFCFKYLLYWAEVCNLLGDLRGALVGLDETQKALIVSNPSICLLDRHSFHPQAKKDQKRWVGIDLFSMRCLWIPVYLATDQR